MQKVRFDQKNKQSKETLQVNFNPLEIQLIILVRHYILCKKVKTELVNFKESEGDRDSLLSDNVSTIR